jgi:two-component system, LytTR family, response regulator
MTMKQQPPFIFIPQSGALRKVWVKDITMASADGSYTNVHTTNGIYMISTNLQTLEQQLVDYGFQRIQKSYLVNLDFIEKVNRDEIMVHGKILPLSPLYRAALLARLRIIYT